MNCNKGCETKTEKKEARKEKKEGIVEKIANFEINHQEKKKQKELDKADRVVKHANDKEDEIELI